MRYLDAGTATRISRIGLGTWQFSRQPWGYGRPYADQEARAIVRRALELGVTLFDTAELYGMGRSEQILGEALGEDRESVFLATKIFTALPVLPVAPVVEQRAVASANRPGSAGWTCTRCTIPTRWSRTARSCAACARCSGSGWLARSASAATPWTAGGRLSSPWAAGC